MGVEKLIKAAPTAVAGLRRAKKLDRLYELPEETAKRAKAAGYDTDVVLFHGTNRDIHEFKLDQTGTRNDPGFYGRGFYFSQSPSVAAEYATKWGSQPSGSNVLPVLVRGNFLNVDIEENGSMAYGLLKNKIRKQWGEETFDRLEAAGPIQEFPDRVREFLMSEGFDGVKITDGPEGFLQEVVVFDNKNARSVFAKFEDTEGGNISGAIGGATLAGGAVVSQDSKAAQFSPFESVLAEVENAQRVGFEEGKWYPHASPEGGTGTLGYGHKLTGQEDKTQTVTISGEQVSFAQGLTEEQALLLFREDIEKHKNKVRKSIKDFDELDTRYQDVLVNIAFNVGNVTEKKWPSLLEAMRAGDDAGVRKEMVTSFADAEGKRHKLLTRARKVADAVGLEDGN